MKLTKVKVIFPRERMGKIFTVSATSERNLYADLHGQVEDYLGHKDFVLNWNDGTTDPAVVCRSEDDLQMALNYREQPPSIKGMADLTLYAVNTGGVAVQDVKPVNPQSPVIFITVGCTDNRGERFSRNFDSASLVGYVATTYSQYRGIPVHALRLQLHGGTVFRTQSIRSLQVADEKIEFQAIWEDTYDEINPPIRIKYVNQEAKTDVLRKSLFKNTTGEYLMKLYAEYVDKDQSTLRFIYDGIRITASDTPVSLGMEDDNVVEVYEEMIGGG